jgi:RHS repeat-associated protein
LPNKQRTAYFDGSTTYSYDPNGNRTMAGYSTGSDNRLTFDGTYTYTYNAEGDLTQKVSTTATWTYSWDNLNRLVSVKDVTTTGTQLSVSYVYDVMNKRVEDDTWTASTGTTVTVRHAYDGNNIWADVTTTNTLLARHVYGDGVDQVWARAIPAGLTNAGVAWYLTDRQGSVRDIMDSSSVIVDHSDSDGFGNATHTTITVADQFGYAGGLNSYDTRMEQFGARWYDAATGRWMSEDPIGFGAGDTNLQRYVGNSPTILRDPSGTFADKDPPPPDLPPTGSGGTPGIIWGAGMVKAPLLGAISNALGTIPIPPIPYIPALPRVGFDVRFYLKQLDPASITTEPIFPGKATMKDKADALAQITAINRAVGAVGGEGYLYASMILGAPRGPFWTEGKFAEWETTIPKFAMDYPFPPDPLLKTVGIATAKIPRMVITVDVQIRVVITYEVGLGVPNYLIDLGTGVGNTLASCGKLFLGKVK